MVYVHLIMQKYLELGKTVFNIINNNKYIIMNKYLIVYKKKDSNDIFDKEIFATNKRTAYNKIKNDSIIIIKIINLYF